MDHEQMREFYPLYAKRGRLLFGLVTLALLLIPCGNYAQPNSDLTAQSAPQRPELGETFLPVTVTTREGRYVGGLRQNNFAIFSDKIPLEITSFNNTSVPAHIAILYDISGSQSVVSVRDETPQAGLVRLALSKFMELSNHRNEYSLIAFNAYPHVLVDGSHDGETVANTVGSLKAKGLTALFDACFMAIEKINRTAYQKRVLIIITDGQDNASKHQDGELLRLLKRSNVVVYTVDFSGYDSWGLPPSVTDIVPELTEISGGFAFYASNKAELNAVFQQIAIELNNQYLVGIKTDAGRSKSHKLKFKVTPPPNSPNQFQRLVVRSRKEYSVE
jgi:VWFA-related protein